MQIWNSVLTACVNLIFKQLKGTFQAVKMFKIDPNLPQAINRFKTQWKCAKMHMGVNLKGNIKCQTYTLHQKNLKLKFYRINTVTQMAIFTITIKMSPTLEFSFKKHSKAIINTIFKMKAGWNKNHILEMQTSSHMQINLIIEIMEVLRIINFKEMQVIKYFKADLQEL